MANTSTRPLPAPVPANRGFFEGLAQDEFRLQRCHDCENRWFPPSAHCPACLSDSWAWQPASGRGRIWSWVTMHRDYFATVQDFAVPYQVAVIKLEEGPLLVSRVEIHDPEELRCDLPVTVDIEQVSDDVFLPVFRPDDAPDGDR